MSGCVSEGQLVTGSTQLRTAGTHPNGLQEDSLVSPGACSPHMFILSVALEERVTAPRVDELREDEQWSQAQQL